VLRAVELVPDTHELAGQLSPFLLDKGHLGQEPFLEEVILDPRHGLREQRPFSFEEDVRTVLLELGRDEGAREMVTHEPTVQRVAAVHAVRVEMRTEQVGPDA